MIHAGKPKGLTRGEKLRNRFDAGRKLIERPWKKAQLEMVHQQSMIATLSRFDREMAKKRAAQEARADAAIEQFLASIARDEDDESCDKLPVGDE